MAKTSVIETERLRIEPFDECHLTKRYVGWLNDPQVVRYSDQRFIRHSLDSCRAYWKSFESSPHYFWAISLKNRDSGHIGNINAFIDTHHRVADLGILIGEPGAWRQRYGLEAWRAVCDLLFRNGVARKISAGCLAPNVAMGRIMTQSGMLPDGTRSRHCLFEGESVDVIHAALFIEHWRP